MWIWWSMTIYNIQQTTGRITKYMIDTYWYYKWGFKILSPSGSRFYSYPLGRVLILMTSHKTRSWGLGFCEADIMTKLESPTTSKTSKWCQNHKFTNHSPTELVKEQGKNEVPLWDLHSSNFCMAKIQLAHFWGYTEDGFFTYQWVSLRNGTIPYSLMVSFEISLLSPWFLHLLRHLFRIWYQPLQKAMS
jgi:hypothetical protein